MSWAINGTRPFEWTVQLKRHACPGGRSPRHSRVQETGFRVLKRNGANVVVDMLPVGCEVPDGLVAADVHPLEFGVFRELSARA